MTRQVKENNKNKLHNNSSRSDSYSSSITLNRNSNRKITDKLDLFQ